MTDLTNNEAAAGALIDTLLASFPKAADLIEATAVLVVAALTTACLNLML